MPRPRKYPQELVDRGVRLALEFGRPVAHVVGRFGIARVTLRKAVRRVEADEGLRPDRPTMQERDDQGAALRELWAAPR